MVVTFCFNFEERFGEVLPFVLESEIEFQPFVGMKLHGYGVNATVLKIAASFEYKTFSIFLSSPNDSSLDRNQAINYFERLGWRFHK